jgi:hypothetical protein
LATAGLAFTAEEDYDTNYSANSFYSSSDAFSKLGGAGFINKNSGIIVLYIPFPIYKNAIPS